jgi:hypothetical protein
MKIIYAIAFVKAVKEKFIDSNEKVPIESVDVYKPFIEEGFLEDEKFREKVVCTLERKGLVH